MKPDNDHKELNTLWSQWEGRRGDLLDRCERYSRWTLPYICAHEYVGNAEQITSNVVFGPRVVNHLAHRVVETMFPNDRPFFTLAMTPEVMKLFKEEVPKDQQGDVLAQIRESTQYEESRAMRVLNITEYRPVAINTLQHLIVTGNGVLRRLKDGRRALYGIRDFTIIRDITGQWRDLILRDCKTFDALPPDLQELYKEHKHSKKEDCNEDAPISLYTRFKQEGKRVRSYQFLDDMFVPKSSVWYTQADCPVMPLTWSLSRGEDYGRGAVEQYAALFHNIDVTAQALLDLYGIVADVKYLVSGGVDPKEWMETARGGAVAGTPDAITVVQAKDIQAIQLLQNQLDNWNQLLAQAFLLSSSSVRQAERVTAEEIRQISRELESAYGGLYASLATNWQKREAEWALNEIKFKPVANGQTTFEVQVTTGTEALSREGQMANLQQAVAELALLEGVPEEVRATINPSKFANFVFFNRGIDFQEIGYSAAEMQAQAEQRQQQQQQLMAQEAAMKAASSSGGGT